MFALASETVDTGDKKSFPSTSDSLRRPVILQSYHAVSLLEKIPTLMTLVSCVKLYMAIQSSCELSS